MKLTQAETEKWKEYFNKNSKTATETFWRVDDEGHTTGQTDEIEYSYLPFESFIKAIEMVKNETN